MPEEIRCPACNSVLNISSTNCDICLRPVSRQWIVRKLQAGKHGQAKKKRLIYAGVALLVFAAAFAALPAFRGAVLKVASPGLTVARAAKDHVAGAIKADWPDFSPKEEPKPPQSPSKGAASPTASEHQALPPAAAPEPVAKAPAAQAPAAPAPRKPAPPAPPAWKVSGLVYSLRDAKPLPGVELAFASTVDPTVKRARTDKAGRYTIELPMLDGGAGYRLDLSAGKRKLSYLEEAALPYRERTPAQRADAVEEARQSPVLHAALSPESLDTTQDFAVLP